MTQFVHLTNACDVRVFEVNQKRSFRGYADYEDQNISVERLGIAKWRISERHYQDEEINAKPGHKTVTYQAEIEDGVSIIKEGQNVSRYSRCSKPSSFHSADYSEGRSKTATGVEEARQLPQRYPNENPHKRVECALASPGAGYRNGNNKYIMTRQTFDLGDALSQMNLPVVTSWPRKDQLLNYTDSR